MSNENELRKQLKSNLKQKERETFDQNLPMSRDRFSKLFDYLDRELSEQDCDNHQTLTRRFLKENRIADADAVLGWLAEKGGYCDCEILFNVEEQFQ